MINNIAYMDYIDYTNAKQRTMPSSNIHTPNAYTLECATKENRNCTYEHCERISHNWFLIREYLNLSGRKSETLPAGFTLRDKIMGK